MRIPIRTSRWAIWARRTASLALPFELIPVFMHRQRMIDSETFTLLFLVGLGIALLAVIVSLIALARLWQSGFCGWPRAVQGLFLGLVLVSPAGIALFWGLTHPPINDVATAGLLPELVIARSDERPRLSEAETARAYPNAVARTYPLPPSEVFALVADLVVDRKWETRIKRQPVAPAYIGRINALAMTWLGFRDEVAVLINWTNEGTMVSMRSASLYGIGDLGANGHRIEVFLTDLDKAVTQAQRLEPVFDTPESDAGTPESVEELEAG